MHCKWFTISAPRDWLKAVKRSFRGLLKGANGSVLREKPVERDYCAPEKGDAMGGGGAVNVLLLPEALREPS